MPKTEPPDTHARARLRRLALVVVPALAALLLLAGPASADEQTFTNPAPIKIPHSGNSGSASLFPSAIAVSGLGGPIADVAVTLHKVGHTWPDDLDILLVSPSGDKVMLMSDACGEDDIEDFTWIFSEQASRAISDDSSDCGELAYRPTNYVGPGFITADFGSHSNPAVLAPHGASLTSLNNKNPNGTWKLYIDDDSDQSPNANVGDIEGGWSIVIKTRPVDVAIPAGATSGLSSGPADPYPATRTVSGETGLITDVNVGIAGIWHERPEDLDLLLVGPDGGEKVILMSDACGPLSVNAFGWTWDDEAAAPMPEGAGTNVCATPVHRPANYGAGDVWPAPAPEGPYSTSLSSLDLSDPNGEWRLFVNDDADGGTGFLTNRFRLHIATRPRAAVAFTETAVELAEGTSRTLTLRRTTSGALAAGAVMVTAVPATATAGDFSLPASVVPFAPGETQKTVQVNTLADGRLEPDEAFTVTIGSPTGDARLATPASVTITIPAPPAAGGGPGGRGGQPGAGDATAPSFVGSVRASPRTFAVGAARRSAGAVQSARRKIKQGTTFRYALSEAARVVFAIERKRAGRRIGKKCSQPTPANRDKRRCTRYARIGAVAQQQANAGRNRKRFSGRIARRRLSPGDYRATLVATDAAGNTSKPKRAAFRVVNP